jgi:hypothetical protein
MEPIKSNLNKENCSPISSNCVIWQGPDLPCIALCTGDTVSDVVYKIAVELCEIKDSFGFTDVDLTCLLNICSTVPEPQKTLTNILNLIINKVCCLSDIVAAIDMTPPGEIEVTLASCFNIVNPFGVPLSQLPVSQYVYEIGVKLCQINTIVNTHTSQISNLQEQINNLPDPTPIPQITTECISGGGVTPGVPTDIDLVVEELERQYCEFTDAVGTVADIVAVQQCPSTDLNTENQLSTGYPMTTLPGWNISPANLAETLKNLWLTVCDIRGAVKIIQDTCCKVTCADIIVDFDVKRDINDDGDFVILLFFGEKTIMPSTWYDCNQTPNAFTPYGFSGNTITITDSAGHVYNAFIPLRSQDLTTGILTDIPVLNTGYEINLSASPIDPTLDFTITSDICVTDGSTTCVKCVNKDVPYTAPISCCTITASGTVTIVYETCTTTTTTTTTLPI